MSHKILAAGLIFVLAHGFAAASGRQEQVRQKSMHVMPFSMDATLHTFAPTSSGGVMTVTVRKANPAQLVLVRSHLRHEASAFAGGHYNDPAEIHGGSMAGLAELQRGARYVNVAYAEIHNGATVTFRTKNKRLISAVHQWFAAQVSDHGHDAMMMR